MNMIHAEAYRTAFSAYLRKGTPIPLSLKQAGTTARYVWRCQGDNLCDRHISGTWRASFSAEVLSDCRNSIYFDPRK